MHPSRAAAVFEESPLDSDTAQVARSKWDLWKVLEVYSKCISAINSAGRVTDF